MKRSSSRNFTFTWAVVQLLLLMACKLPCLPPNVMVADRCVPYDQLKGLCAHVCDDRVCGDDGCGGSCGTCDKKTPHCVNGACAAECEPNCTDKVCGDDGCGGSCGTCDGTCTPNGQACAPKAFTCEARFWDDGAICDCGCGAVDPDCNGTPKPVGGCAGIGATCNGDGTCSEGLGASWTCARDAYQDGRVCNCGCGAPDPDCAIAGARIAGCAGGQICSDAGQCAPPPGCVASCDGRHCGSDGCGGSCGNCADSEPFCNDGQCGATCTPRCAGAVCGDNGCGGDCGTCGSDEMCDAQQCVPIPPELSCAGHCGGSAPFGCSCDASCIAQGGCCLDAEAQCGCFPKCVNRVCGDDGCGHACGTCDAGLTCTPDGTCVDDPCLPDPCSGHGTCASGSGACACAEGFAGSSCGHCADGFTGYPACVANPCVGVSCGFYGTCDPANGACICDAGYQGAQCDTCAGAGTFPACAP